MADWLQSEHRTEVEAMLFSVLELGSWGDAAAEQLGSSLPMFVNMLVRIGPPSAPQTLRAFACWHRKLLTAVTGATSDEQCTSVGKVSHIAAAAATTTTTTTTTTSNATTRCAAYSSAQRVVGQSTVDRD